MSRPSNQPTAASAVVTALPMNKTGNPDRATEPSVINPPLPWAIIVTHHPDLTRLRALVHQLENTVAHVLVLDNSPPGVFCAALLAAPKPQHISVHLLGRNTGIAYAQNRGIAMARNAGALHVLLLDQDSLPAPDMVFELLLAWQHLCQEGAAPAALGPACVDLRTQKTAAICPPIQKGYVTRSLLPGERALVNHVISSGSLISIDVLDKVGPMDEALFIDYVDIEWCLRARQAGYAVFTIEKARLFHHLGDKIIRFLGREIPMHGPLRHYYLIRNGVYLQKKQGVSGDWKKADRILILKRFVFYGVFSWPPGRHLRYMIYGFLDGLRGKMGPFSPRM